MNEAEILELIKSRLTIHITPSWGEYRKRLEVELRLDNETISSDTVDMSDIREDF